MAFHTASFALYILSIKPIITATLPVGFYLCHCSSGCPPEEVLAAAQTFHTYPSDRGEYQSRPSVAVVTLSSFPSTARSGSGSGIGIGSVGEGSSWSPPLRASISFQMPQPGSTPMSLLPPNELLLHTRAPRLSNDRTAKVAAVESAPVTEQEGNSMDLQQFRSLLRRPARPLRVVVLHRCKPYTASYLINCKSLCPPVQIRFFMSMRHP